MWLTFMNGDELKFLTFLRIDNGENNYSILLKDQDKNNLVFFFFLMKGI